MEKHIASYREYMQNRGYSASTVKYYTAGVLKMMEYLKEERHLKRIHDASVEDLKSYSGYVYGLCRERDGIALSASAKSLRLKAVKLFFKYLMKKGEIIFNPAEGVELPREARNRLRDTLKEKEIKRVIESAGGGDPIGLRDRAILELLYSTGMRNTELRELKVKDIDLKGGEVYIKKGKGYFGHKERVVPLGRMAGAYIEEYLNEARDKLVAIRKTDNLFLSSRGNKLDIGTPVDIARKYAKEAGMTKYISAHMFRHSCATHLLRGGADIRYVQELLGHKSLESTKIYTKLEISDLKRIHRKTHPREKS